MSEENDFSGLADLRKTLLDVTEVIAAFVGAANSEELPVESLMEAADESLADVVKWRSGSGSALIFRQGPATTRIFPLRE